MTGISSDRANGGTSSTRSPLQKRPGSYQLVGRPVFARIAEEHYEPVLTAVLVATALAGLATALV